MSAEMIEPSKPSRRRAGEGMSGMEYLQALVHGDLLLPPMVQLMGFTLTLVEEGRAVLTVTPGRQHDNNSGITHGGLAATLLDSAMGIAVHSTLPAGAGFTTLDLTVHYVATVTDETGPVLGEGRVLHRGGRTATAEGRMTRVKDGRLLAHATTTGLLTLPQRPSQGVHIGASTAPSSGGEDAA